MRIAKPSSPPDHPTFYQPQDFAIGTTIEVKCTCTAIITAADILPLLQVLKHRFTLTDADEYVLKYMEAHAEQFPLATIQSLQRKHGKLPTT